MRRQDTLATAADEESAIAEGFMHHSAAVDASDRALVRVRTTTKCSESLPCCEKIALRARLVRFRNSSASKTMFHR